MKTQSFKKFDIHRDLVSYMFSLGQVDHLFFGGVRIFKSKNWDRCFKDSKANKNML